MARSFHSANQMGDMKRCSVELDGTIAGVLTLQAQNWLERKGRVGLNVVRRTYNKKKKLYRQGH